MQIGYTPVKMSGDTKTVVDNIHETDEQVMARIRERFQTLEDYTRVIKNGKMRSLLVSGAPGVGKSYGVERVLGASDVMSQLAGNEPTYEIVKGVTSAIGLYAKLYNYKSSKNVIVFDDCDSPFKDEDNLNMLKAIMDTGKRRVITWAKNSKLLEKEGIPNQFEFKGGVIFISNRRLSSRSGKMSDHIEAIIDRCHKLDLTVHTEREKILRIKQVVNDGMLKDSGLSEYDIDELLNYVYDNKSRFSSLSLRTVKLLSELRLCWPDKWRKMAELDLINH